MEAVAPTRRRPHRPLPPSRRTDREIAAAVATRAATLLTGALVLMALGIPRPAAAQDATPATSLACHDAVQGEIAWDYRGSTRWAEGNVERLCEGAEESTEPAVCFQRAMHGGLERGEGTEWHWQQAMDLCAGTRDAEATLSCYRDRTRSGLGWRESIEVCARDARPAEDASAGDGRDGDGEGGMVVATDAFRQAGAEMLAASTSPEEAIAAKYRKGGGRSGRLGAPTGPVRVNPGKTGKRRRYENGHIYWSPGSGAHVIYFGAIWDKWSEQEWEQGELGYPIQDQRTNPDGTGRRQRFQGGHIYWHPRTGAHVLRDGTVWEQWADQGWEQGALGYPTSDPLEAGGMIRQSFQNGQLTGRADIGGRYLTASSGLCLTLNVFDQPNSTGDKIKRALKTAFDPREHARALAAGAGGAFLFGPGGGELASAIQHLRTAKKVGDAWKGDLVHGTGVTLMECGSVAPKFQRFQRDERFVRVVARPGKCVKAKQGQTGRNGGRVQMGACRQHQRAAWYLDDGQLRNGRGKCLDVHAPQLDEEGAKVQLWSCNGARQQRWSFQRP